MAFPGFNYIGSKTKLLGFITTCIESYTSKPLSTIQSFFDGFSGTGSVSYYMISKGIPQIITNDIQYYSFIVSSVLTKQNLDITKLKNVIQSLDTLDYTNPAERDFIYTHYSNASTHSDRMYFTPDNAIRIDRIRQHIERLYSQTDVNQTEYYCLIKLLLYAVTKISNTSSTYGAYLKNFKTSSLKQLTLDPNLIDLLHNENVEHTALNNNITEIHDNQLQNTEVCYLDPPYNSRDYSSNYHVLETVAKYDYPSIRGKTGLRDDLLTRSNFCSKVHAPEAFRQLFRKIKSEYIFVSYSSESIVSQSQMTSLLQEHWDNVVCYEQPYQRFKSNSNGDQNKTVTEYIFAAKKRTS